VKKWKAIVFDLDDTLYPEYSYVLSGFRAVAEWARLQLDIPFEKAFAELCSLFDSGVRGNTFNQWLARYSIMEDVATVQQMIAVYRNHEPVLVPFAGVRELLGDLHHYHRLGLVSDGYLAVQRKKLSALDLAQYLDAVVFSDEWGREYWKPHPRPFQVVLQRLSVRASQAVYVADNPLKDFFGARAVGMKTIWYRRHDGEYANHEPPTDAHAPDTVIQSLDKLRYALTEILHGDTN